jgi:8-oxo-dGTP pyrophosphatase MutT (NUDIX family)
MSLDKLRQVAVQNLDMTLIEQLHDYSPYDSTEAAHLDRVMQFLQHAAHPFHRETLEGHMTASAIVVNPTYSQIVLLHHRKLDRWLQPGGHCDGNPNSLAVALQEVWEETGLVATAVNDQIFDIDVHPIPARGTVPAHWHYDIRYLLVADDSEPLQRSEREAIALQWIPFTQLAQVAPEASFRRVEAKVAAYRNANGFKQDKREV